MLATGLCLLSAPAARADLDDVFDTIIGGADAAQTADADTQPGTVNFGSYNDPLAQLARLFRDAPAGSEGAPTELDDTDRPQSGNTDSGDDSSDLPKPSTPNGGGGGGGGNGNGNGNSGSGNHSGNHAKTKAHPNSAKASPGLHKADVDDNR